MRKYRRGEPYSIVDLMKLLSKSKKGRMEWSMYQSVKESTRLFPPNIGDWSLSQKFFVYWASFYDSVHQSIDRPPERVIEDDVLLEQWLKQQEEKIKAMAEKSWSESVAKKDIKTAWNQPEVIVMDGT